MTVIGQVAALGRARSAKAARWRSSTQGQA
jgi:hypothetical protein